MELCKKVGALQLFKIDKVVEEPLRNNVDAFPRQVPAEGMERGVRIRVRWL